MNQRHIRILGLATMLVSLPVATVNIDLVEYAFNINGVTTNGAAPAGVNLGSFDTVTGLGTVRVTQGGAGSHFVGLFVDHEFDEPVNTLFNENAAVTGTAASGQSWEIDEPTGSSASPAISTTTCWTAPLPPVPSTTATRSRHLPWKTYRWRWAGISCWRPAKWVSSCSRSAS